jgi:hypothetical protein
MHEDDRLWGASAGSAPCASSETGLPEPSFLNAHIIQVLPKKRLFDRLPRTLSASQLQEVVAMIRPAVDPDAPYRLPHR